MDGLMVRLRDNIRRQEGGTGMTDVTDEELMLMLKYGNRDAFDTLFDEYKGPVLNFIWRMVGNRDTAEDLLIEVFTTLFDRRKDYNVQGRFSSWLFTIARNITLNEVQSAGHRRWQKVIYFSDAFAESGGMPATREAAPSVSEVEVDLLASESHDALGKLLAALPPKYREIIVLHELEGLSYGEIAVILSVPEATARTRVHRARRELRRLYKGENVK
jgi:RNA polymerase sigma-70 factor (ECF subfamily)